MKPSDSHPDRAALRAAVQSGNVPFSDHLKSCPVCRELFALLQQVQLAGDEPLEAPTAAAVASWSAIPLLDDQPGVPTRLQGSIAFDSWAQAGAVAVRDISVGDVRRLVLTAGALAFEIVAERLQAGWECVARVYDKGNVCSGLVLRIGNRKVLPTAQGFYHWTTSQGPRSMVLLATDREIEFENPSWL